MGTALVGTGSLSETTNANEDVGATYERPNLCLGKKVVGECDELERLPEPSQHGVPSHQVVSPMLVHEVLYQASSCTKLTVIVSNLAIVTTGPVPVPILIMLDVSLHVENVTILGTAIGAVGHANAIVTSE